MLGRSEFVRFFTLGTSIKQIFCSNNLRLQITPKFQNAMSYNSPADLRRTIEKVFLDITRICEPEELVFITFFQYSKSTIPQ